MLFSRREGGGAWEAGGGGASRVVRNMRAREKEKKVFPGKIPTAIPGIIIQVFRCFRPFRTVQKYRPVPETEPTLVPVTGRVARRPHAPAIAPILLDRYDYSKLDSCISRDSKRQALFNITGKQVLRTYYRNPNDKS